MLAVDAAVLRPQARAVSGQLAALERHLVGAAGIARARNQITPALGVARYHHQAPAGGLKLFDSHGVACWSHDRMCTRCHIYALLVFVGLTWSTMKAMSF